MRENNLNEMYKGYTEALVWAEIPSGSDEYNWQTLEEMNLSPCDLTPDAQAAIRDELSRFYDLMFIHHVIVPADSWEQVGRDLYFTRQCHGTGFWDRPETYGQTNAQRLTALVEDNFSETYTWVEGESIMVESYIPTTAEAVCV